MSYSITFLIVYCLWSGRFQAYPVGLFSIISNALVGFL
jgi:hypothetical protein